MLTSRVPERPVDLPFLMPVEDVFTIEGRGTVVDRPCRERHHRRSEEVEIIGLRDTMKTTVHGHRNVPQAARRRPSRRQHRRAAARHRSEGVERGQVIAKPGSITPHKKFKAEVYVLTKEEGGRHTPFFTNYRPQFYFRTTDVTGIVKLPAGVEMVMPGDNVKMAVELITPIAMDKGLRFAIREGGRTVGAGVVAKILE